MDVEHLVEPRDLEDPPRGRLGQDDRELAADLTHPPDGADDRAEGGRVEKRDAGEIEDESWAARAVELRHDSGEQLPETGRVVRVELAAQGDDGRPTVVMRLVEIVHRAQSCPEAPRAAPPDRQLGALAQRSTMRSPSRITVVSRPPKPPQLDQKTSEMRPPTAPTTIRITPTVWRSTPDTSADTAHVRIAPTAIRMRLTPMPMPFLSGLI